MDINYNAMTETESKVFENNLNNCVIEEKMEEETSKEITYVDRQIIKQFTDRLSGKNEAGLAKANVSYQYYILEDPEEVKDSATIYNASHARVEISQDKKNPGFYVLDVIFDSYDDPELKLMWGRLQRFKKAQLENPDKTPIFYINILESDGVSIQELEQNTLLVGNVLNPLLFYLTREVPNLLALETKEEDVLYGGNMIRMLVSEQLITFTVTDIIDTSVIKEEVEREFMESDYINNTSSIDS